MKQRRYDIDWLRIIAMLAVFLLITIRFILRKLRIDNLSMSPLPGMAFFSSIST